MFFSRKNFFLGAVLLIASLLALPALPPSPPGAAGNRLRDVIIITEDYYIEENLTLDGDEVIVEADSAPITIQVNYSYSLTVLDSFIHSTGRYGFVVVSYGRLIMKNTTVSDFGRSGHAGSIMVAYSSGNYIENCTFRNFTGPISFSSTTDLVIRDCQFINYTSAPWTYIPGSGERDAALSLILVRNATVAGNSIVDVKGGDGGTTRDGQGVTPPITCGLVMEAVYNVTAENNEIRGVRGGKGGNAGALQGEPGSGGSAMGIYLTSSRWCTLRDNTISEVYAGNAGLPGAGSTSSKPPKGGTAAGVYVDSSVNSTLRDSTIDGVHGGNGSVIRATGGPGGDSYGIYSFASDNTTVEGCHINAIIGGAGGRPSKGGFSGGSAYGILCSRERGVQLVDNDCGGVNGGRGADRVQGGEGYGICLISVEEALLKMNSASFINGGEGGYNPTGPNASGGIAGGICLAGSEDLILLSNIVNGVTGGVGGGGGTSIQDYSPGYGILVKNCVNGTVEYNDVRQAFSYGAYLEGTSAFRIYRNNFRYNNLSGTIYNASRIQAYDDSGGENVWNTSQLYFFPLTFPGAGNYFMDWALNNRSNDMNGDGRVDWPYLIDGGESRDHYPLTDKAVQARLIECRIVRPGDGAYIPSSTVTVDWSTPLPGDIPVEHTLISLDDGGFQDITSPKPGGRWQYTFEGLPEGPHTVDVVLIFPLSYYSMDTVNFIVDTTPPDVEILEPVGPYCNGTPSVVWTAEDNMGLANITLIWDSTQVVLDPEVTSYPVHFTTSGNHTIEVVAADLAGNVARDNITITVDIDPPRVEITSPEEGESLEMPDVEVTWTGTDPTTYITRYEVRLDEGDWMNTDGESSFTFLNLSAGPHRVTVRAYDVLNNSGEDSVNFTVEAPPTPEELSVEILSPEEGAYLNTLQVHLRWSGSGPVVGYRIITDPEGGGERVDVGNVTEYTLTLTEGAHTIMVEAYDASNRTAADRVNFTLDITPPVVYVEAFRGAVNPGESLTIHFSATDSTGVERVEVNVTYINGTHDVITYTEGLNNLSFTFPPSEETGMHILQILAWDLAGNFNSSHRMGIKVTWDADYDGMNDSWEREHGLDPLNKEDAASDPDGDGLTNLQEYLNGTDPMDSDSDDDGYPDGEEVAGDFNPRDPGSHPAEEGEEEGAGKGRSYLIAAAVIAVVVVAALAALVMRKGGGGLEAEE